MWAWQATLTSLSIFLRHGAHIGDGCSGLVLLPVAFDASERHVQGELVTSPHCGTVGANSRGRPSRRRPPTQVRLKFVSGTSPNCA